MLDLDNFVGVLGVGGASRVSDMLLLVKGIELYKAAFSLSIGMRAAESVNLDGRAWPRPVDVTLTDDLGTSYSLMNRGGGGGFMSEWTHNYAVTPMLDSEAKILKLEIPRIQIDSGMGRRGNRPPEQMFLAGPWIIELALPEQVEKLPDSGQV